ncbi:unnamed protein product, partial [Heterotrigona itama]
EKIPFECGFNPIPKFSLPFSLIRLLFLILDIEITLLIPLTIYLKYGTRENEIFSAERYSR